MHILNIYAFVTITGSIFAAATSEKPSPLFQQCADYISRQQDPTNSKRNRLQDDPEQQLEHAHEKTYQNLIAQLQQIEKELLHEDAAKKSEQFELACRAIAQALLHCHDAGTKGALEHAHTCIMQVAGYILLMQHPFWQTMVHTLKTKKHALGSKVYTPSELEKELKTNETRKDLLIKELLKQLEQQHPATSTVPAPLVEELQDALVPLKKSSEELIETLLKLETPMQAIRTKDAKKAIALYNGAVASEIQADIQFLRLKDKHEYLQLERTYCAVALLYLKAHDRGHVKGLEEAEKIMRSRIIETIITWKERHRIKYPYANTSDIWMEINKRKHTYSDPAAPASSGT